MRDRILRNLTGKLVGELGSRLVSFAFNLVLARGLGDAGYGRYSYAYAFAGLVALCGELGLNTLLTSEAARDRDKAAAWVRAFAPLRGLSIALVALATIALAFANRDRSRALEIALMAVYMAANSLLDYHTAVFTAFEQMRRDAGMRIATRLTVSAAGIAAVLAGLPLLWVLAAVAGGNALAAGLGWFWRRRAGLVFGAAWDGAFVRRLLVSAIPTTAAWIGISLYFYMDNLVLGALGFSDALIGQYGAASKVLDASQGLPLIVVGGIFPVVAELSRTGGPEKVAPFFTYVSRVCLVLGAPIAAVAAVASPFVAGLLYGPSYWATGRALALLAIAAPLYYSNLVALFLLLAMGRRWEAAILRIGASLLKVVAMTVAARSFGQGASSAAVALIVADAALLVVLVFWRSANGLAEPGERVLLLKVAIAAGAAVAFWRQTERLHFVAQAVAVGVAFFAAYAVLGLLARPRAPVAGGTAR